MRFFNVLLSQIYMISTNKNQIIEISSKLFNRNYFHFDGRASHSIYTLLCILKEFKNNKIAIPSIVCQSILSAVIEAGWEPYFCDIDINTGNVPLKEFKLAYKEGIRFFLHVQLYGNSNNIDKLSNYFENKSVFIIEDCCQSYGGFIDKKPLGSFGQASVISFGHSKLIDVGCNSLLMTNDKHLLKEMSKFKMKPISLKGDLDKNLFIKTFYDKKKLFDRDLNYSNFKNIIKLYKQNLFKKWIKSKEDEILINLKKIRDLVNNRREKFNLYIENIDYEVFKKVEFPSECVPWRANFLIKKSNLREQISISESLRKKNINVSNWYIPVYFFLNNKSKKLKLMNHSLKFSSKIIQFWINDEITKNKIMKDLKIINNIKNKIDK
jgi:perosamine synthetase